MTHFIDELKGDMTILCRSADVNSKMKILPIEPYNEASASTMYMKLLFTGSEEKNVQLHDPLRRRKNSGDVTICRSLHFILERMRFFIEWSVFDAS